MMCGRIVGRIGGKLVAMLVEASIMMGNGSVTSGLWGHRTIKTGKGKQQHGIRVCIFS